jgi:hypothetical protein
MLRKQIHGIWGSAINLVISDLEFIRDNRTYLLWLAEHPYGTKKEFRNRPLNESSMPESAVLDSERKQDKETQCLSE